MCNLTNNCNQACKHCVSNAKCGSGEELQYRIIECLIHDLEQMGKDYLLTLVGGEATIWTDFRKLLKQKEFKKVRHKMLYTNATYLDAECISLIREADFYEVRVSIDSDRPQEHDDLRGEGTFREAIKNTRHLVESGIPVTSATVLKNNNICRIDKMIYFMQSLGIKIMHLIPLFLTGRGYLAQTYSLSNKDLGSFLQELTIKYHSMLNQRHPLCGNGTAYFKIECNGDCYFQQGRDKNLIGNLYESSFVKLYGLATTKTVLNMINCEDCECYSKPILCSNMYTYCVADINLTKKM